MGPVDDARSGGGLRVLAALKAAREFGLEPAAAAEIAHRRDPRAYGLDALVEALAAALVQRDALRVPEGL